MALPGAAFKSIIAFGWIVLAKLYVEVTKRAVSEDEPSHGHSPFCGRRVARGARFCPCRLVGTGDIVTSHRKQISWVKREHRNIEDILVVSTCGDCVTNAAMNMRMCKYLSESMFSALGGLYAQKWDCWIIR